MEYQTITGKVFRAALFVPSLRDFHELEIIAKEVKCRKPCRCSVCKRIIQRGEVALKTTQRHHITEFQFNSYCNECYTVKL